MNPPHLTRPLAAAAALAAMPVRAEVTVLPPVPDAVGFAGAFAGVHGGQLIAGGGANFPDGTMPWDGGKKVWHERLFALDLKQSGATWQEAGKLPAPNGYGVSLTVPEGVLLIGGGDVKEHFREVKLMTYSNGTTAFRELAALPVPLAQMAGAVTGRRVHVCGGIEKPDATAASAGHWMFDLDAMDKGWQTLPPLPGPGRILATAAGIGGDFILTGGCSLAADAAGKPVRTYLRDAWKFSGGQWQRLADMPRASVAAASPAPVRGDALFVISGDDGKHVGSPKDHRGFTRGILRYDVSEDAWSSAGELDAPAPVTLPTAPWRDGFILFNGEVKPGVRTPQVLIFTPPES
ncbi:galactose oxidase [Luteolibacter arcticus]|uniref:Galactose oxidase n=1 Tax=Luteolibacter arcticus TaxID=1581411 RepID=A0ABT3GQG2_9BACT|nr:galactose oxidase [Luteolibacter arcticus]MCW1925768.1 galactose oxidase [Luteolibacter arcticus]